MSSPLAPPGSSPVSRSARNGELSMNLGAVGRDSGSGSRPRSHKDAQKAQKVGFLRLLCLLVAMDSSFILPMNLGAVGRGSRRAAVLSTVTRLGRSLALPGSWLHSARSAPLRETLIRVPPRLGRGWCSRAEYAKPAEAAGSPHEFPAAVRNFVPGGTKFGGRWFMADEQVRKERGALHEPWGGRARLPPSRRPFHHDPARQEPRPTGFMATEQVRKEQGTLS